MKPILMEENGLWLIVITIHILILSNLGLGFLLAKPLLFKVLLTLNVKWLVESSLGLLPLILILRTIWLGL